MMAASADQEFERAAALRDKLEPLRWLAGKLEQMRRAHTEGSFIYPVVGLEGPSIWYLIHGSRTVAAVLAPRDADSARVAAEIVEKIYCLKSSIFNNHDS
jgi:excinuclease ABC subunit C